ncbi:uncharacterized protein LOC6725266 isoform X3 [Drosophila simulans]|uniref:Uncharacterized protein, isoform A n=2 Tax=melanogaster subgroup TaxID=32351 RepID=Q9W426_DROME|nr:uncharacterized protein Dmel_CG14445, isoform A [Drosophila melanogaster]XP_016038273.1 uncharacterized protein LOC6725266 isoform X3 [Drosophila simulans]XP_033170026.1 uncharacterized protein LOC117147289 isoform X2 [Drosophila mauritiana]AAF46134.2 uncharacterized protein Dmel_CG14445, isoform A [Drosophila melanogaster]KMZ08431.1 uncharacterized protein Dsimw501_GD16788, isoform D [Drosophila simulans]|eukprot:NP_572301.2 uncharacterized protein Dmel_CG14445, isoform A [Drosophila melanogaster]
MSFLGNTSDLECEKNEFPRQRPSGIITKVAAHKLSAEPKWTDKREDDSDSEVSSPDNFLTKGAFLLTPSYELSMERAALICEKMAFKGCFSLTKTATGILFKFSHPDDYQAVFKKGFHKVTGARFYRKIAIPCRPRKTFTLYVLDVPEDLPVEDIRHAMYKFDSVVEVVRLHIYSSLASNAANATSSSAVAASSSSGGGDKGVEGEQIQLLHTPTQTLRRAALRSVSKSVGSVVGDAIEKAERPERRELPPAVIRVTLASMDEYNILLQNGLNFYDATFFPTEANISLKGAKIDYKRRMLDGSIPGRVRELLPVFDAAGFCKLPPPTSKLIKPPRS